MLAGLSASNARSAPQWADIQSNGAVTARSASGATYSAVQNPTAAVAKANQTAASQAPLVVMAAGGVMTLITNQATACSATIDGQVRFNRSTRAQQICDFNGLGSWSDLASSSPGATLSYTTPGSYSWTVPSGVSSATFYAGGAGAGYGTFFDGVSTWYQCPSSGAGQGAASSVSGPGGTVSGNGGNYGGNSYGGSGTGGTGTGQTVVAGSTFVPYSPAAGAILDGYAAGKGTTWGGGGGGIAKSTVTVATGQTYTIVVGARGGSARCDFQNAGDGIVVIKY